MPLTVKLADGKTAQEGLIYTMGVVMLFAGINHVTDKLFPAFVYRVRMFENAHEPKGILVETASDNSVTFRNFTDEELELFRGARFNVPSKTHAQFKKDLSNAWFDMRSSGYLRDHKIFDHSYKGGK